MYQQNSEASYCFISVHVYDHLPVDDRKTADLKYYDSEVDEEHLIHVSLAGRDEKYISLVLVGLNERAT